MSNEHILWKYAPGYTGHIPGKIYRWGGRAFWDESYEPYRTRSGRAPRPRFHSLPPLPRNTSSGTSSMASSKNTSAEKEHSPEEQPVNLKYRNGVEASEVPASAKSRDPVLRWLSDPPISGYSGCIPGMYRVFGRSFSSALSEVRKERLLNDRLKKSASRMSDQVIDTTD